uniref:Uncharacterized protein n=1 Tax=Rhizophora mucronata TaxID=61149 RepID=A0A2P2QFP8_RHIMU
MCSGIFKMDSSSSPSDMQPFDMIIHI